MQAILRLICGAPYHPTVPDPRLTPMAVEACTAVGVTSGHMRLHGRFYGVHVEPYNSTPTAMNPPPTAINSTVSVLSPTSQSYALTLEAYRVIKRVTHARISRVC
eukprot:6866946-Pyramimonas_sp.AAC.1